MGDRDGNSQIRLDEYSNLSLWQMIGAGDGKALQKLKAIVNSILNSHPVIQGNKPLSLLISGEAGKRTHGHAFLRALGCEEVRFSPAALPVNNIDLTEFLGLSDANTGFVISDLHSVPGPVLKKWFEILSQGKFTTIDFKREKIVYPVFGTIVMTMRDKMKLPIYLKECFTHIIALDKYTEQQKELIALQRLKYSNIQLESDEVLRTLILYGKPDLNSLIRLLNVSITIMMSEGRNVLTSYDIRTGNKLK